MLTVNQATLDQTEYLATSDRYNVITTSKVIDRFTQHGFSVNSYREAGNRVAEKENKVRHYVRMKLDTVNGVDREIVIMNSYDSSTSLRLHFGLTRLVCNNGLILSENFIPAERIKHTHQTPFERIDSFIELMQSKLDEELELRTIMENTYLSHYDMYEFTKKAINLREDDLSKILDISQLNIAERPEDIGKNIWLTYQRIQSNLINGNYKKLGVWTDNQTGESFEKYKQAKILTDGNRLINVNSKLHGLAMSFL
jgi:hypothetical protein